VTARFAAVNVHNESVTAGGESRPTFTCALVNNMPDGAFDATERQFFGLLDEAAGPQLVEVRRYTMVGVPRGERTSKRIADEYFSLADIYLNPPDLLIVTGSNPIEERIDDEPYWSDLVELLSWARGRVDSTLLSCLAAHAALTVFDGISRTRLPEKCTGVFPQSVDEDHPLTRDIGAEIVLPHSRWNSAPRDELERAGFDVSMYSDATGWGLASRIEDGRQLILIQGHPEYDPSSLLREYRRDATRYVNGERDDPPQLPLNCVGPRDWENLAQLHQRVTEGGRDPHVLDDYPFDDLGAQSPWPWRGTATRLYSNWLSSVTRKES
jgi:homoserine O-succinyltransferase/O-acetyltransferase